MNECPIAFPSNAGMVVVSGGIMHLIMQQLVWLGGGCDPPSGEIRPNDEADRKDFGPSKLQILSAS